MLQTVPYNLSSGCLKRLFCAATTKEEDKPGRERERKGELRGAFGHVPVMHFQQAMSHMQAADTQDPAGPPLPPSTRTPPQG